MESAKNGISQKWNQPKMESAKNGMSKNGMSKKWNEQKME